MALAPVENQFSDDDMQASDIGGGNPTTHTAPVDTRNPQQKAADTRRARASSVNPDDAVDPDRSGARNKGGRPRNKSAEELAEEKAKADSAKKDEQIKKTRETIDKVINPALAIMGKMALQIPPQLAWMSPVTDQHDQPITINGVPQLKYENGAELLILQPFETEIICMMAPTILDLPQSETAKKIGKKLAPVALIGGGVVLAGSYLMRLKQVAEMLEPHLASMRRVNVKTNEENQARNGVVDTTIVGDGNSGVTEEPM